MKLLLVVRARFRLSGLGVESLSGRSMGRGILRATTAMAAKQRQPLPAARAPDTAAHLPPTLSRRLWRANAGLARAIERHRMLVIVRAAARVVICGGAS
jgi:hypothetical protein